jgi:plastocyanin
MLLGWGVVLLGCGGGGGNEPPPNNVTAASATGGNAQAGPVAQALPSALEVTVTEGGNPAAGVTVNWATGSSGGVLTPPSGPTDANGVASSTWSLGTAAGAQTATATVSGASGSPVTFTATATAGAASALVDAGGNGQSAELGAQLPLPVQARVTDEHGNGVSGTVVGWSATGGTVSSATVPTDPTGVSPVTVTAGGTAGPIIITATADGLDGSPLDFNATAVPIVPAPAAASVSVGNNSFRSNRNATANPAVDTVAVDGTVTWTLVGTGTVTHNVLPQGMPTFTASAPLTAGENYSFQFTAAGRYEYTCAFHPGQMTGRIIVR